MLMAVVLAAGEGKRMGEIKQLLDWQGEPLLRHTVRNVLAGGFAQVRVVLGAYAEAIAPVLEGLEIELIYNPDYAQGQSTSLRAGLLGHPERSDIAHSLEKLDLSRPSERSDISRHLEQADLSRYSERSIRLQNPDNIHGAAFIPGDMPLIASVTLAKMISYFQEQQPGILVPIYHGERGNPVFFHQKFFPELLAVEGDRGGREIIRQYPEEVQKLEVLDPGVIIDMDYREDYLRLSKQMRTG